MPSKGNIVDAFFALLRAGLWEQSVRLLPFSPVDFGALYKMAEEQSVIGLIAAGLEHVEDMKLSKQQVMPFMKQVISLEHRNSSMNIFIGNIIEKLREAGIQALLVKGQGIAQCYERPLLRSCGDVDLLLSPASYEKAKEFLLTLSEKHGEEISSEKHFDMIIESWSVEIHGTMHCRLAKRIDCEIDDVQLDTFENNNNRIWEDGTIIVQLPSPDNDLIFVFTHILKHFFRGGIGVRQVCDWSRLLWTYRNEIDVGLLYGRLQRMRLISEWKAFSAFAVYYLGLAPYAVPLFDESARWKKKAKRLRGLMLHSGNFGHNRDVSYYDKYPYIYRKIISFGHWLSDSIAHSLLFPLDSLRVFCIVLKEGLFAVIKHK